METRDLNLALILDIVATYSWSIISCSRAHITNGNSTFHNLVEVLGGIDQRAFKDEV